MSSLGNTNHEQRVVFSHYDDEGIHSPYPIPDAQEAQRYIREELEPFLDQRTAQVISELEEASALREFDDTRLRHFFNALELPFRPLVVIKDPLDRATKDIFARHELEPFFTAPFAPSLVASYLPSHRMTMIDGSEIEGKFTESVAAHEHTHASAIHTVMVPPNNGEPIITRSGFIAQPNIFQAMTNEEAEVTGLGWEEGTADIARAGFNSLILGVEEGPRVQNPFTDLSIPTRYVGTEEFHTVSTPAALNIELLALQDPEIITHMFASRTSVEGLARFARSVNEASQGRYREISRTQMTWGGVYGMLEKTIDTLFDGDRSCIDETGAVAHAYMRNKLVAYQTATGYDFHLKS